MSELSAEELREWEAYYQLEPFGEQWAQTALLATLTANANRDSQQHPEPFTLEDFLPVKALNTEVVYEQQTEAAPDEPEPAWKQWKRAFAMMAEASAEQSKE